MENTSDLVSGINANLDSRHADAMAIQVALVELLKQVSGMTPQEINSLPDWVSLFAGEKALSDRRKIGSWFEGFAPIKVQWNKESGKFERVKYCSKKAAALQKASFDGKAWNVGGAEDALWSEFEPQKATVAKAASIELKSLDPILRVIVRAIDERNGLTGVVTANMVIDELDKLRNSPDFMGHVTGTVSNVLDSDKHSDWQAGRRKEVAPIEEKKAAAKAIIGTSEEIAAEMDKVAKAKAAKAEAEAEAKEVESDPMYAAIMEKISAAKAAKATPRRNGAKKAAMAVQ